MVAEIIGRAAKNGDRRSRRDRQGLLAGIGQLNTHDLYLFWSCRDKIGDDRLESKCFIFTGEFMPEGACFKRAGFFRFCGGGGPRAPSFHIDPELASRTGIVEVLLGHGQSQKMILAGFDVTVKRGVIADKSPASLQSGK